ncbi:MAG TPA: peptidoglycan DD-metalloendopeptidase family protein, partial [Stenotrophobium sp.]|jgi:septal ring factor EnvC (AmiA/AmiB activator)|nr:peptidoglycan DD-metalloendopeptidase family protein [Stenotrophobium sp.]
MIRTLLLLAVAVFGCSAACAADDASLGEHQKQLEQVQSRIQALSQQLQNERGKQDALHQQLQDSEQEIARSTARLRHYNRQIAALQRKINATHDERRQTMVRLNAQKQALAQQIRAAYMIGQGGQLRLLLNQENAQKLDRISTYYDYLGRARLQYINDIHASLDHLTALRDKLSEQHDQLQSLKDQQQQTVAALQKTREQRQQMVREIDSRVASNVDELKQLQASEQQLKKLMQSLRDALKDMPVEVGHDKRPFPKLRGELPWPVRGRLLASYGEAKANGHLSWNGIWIAAREGADVHAVAKGRVAYVGWLQRYGLIIILQHEDGYYTLYGHNNTVLKTAGESVQAGETIAEAGATGGYEQDGVYFELRKGTDPVDPLKWLRK